MSKQAFAQARQLIHEKRYREARSVLERIDHPKATEWIMRVDSLAPGRRQPRMRKSAAIMFIVFALLLGSLAIAAVLGNQRINRYEEEYTQMVDGCKRYIFDEFSECLAAGGISNYPPE